VEAGPDLAHEIVVGGIGGDAVVVDEERGEVDAIGLDFDSAGAVAVNPDTVGLVDAIGVGGDGSVPVIPWCSTKDSQRIRYDV